MKCPKCAYLGFETTERCRNCGYDFSLSVHVGSPSELSLRNGSELEAPLADFDLSGLDTSTVLQPPTAGLDLDRVIGAIEPHAPAGVVESAARAAPRAEARPVHTATAVATPPAEEVQEFFVAAPPPAGPPLAVRRATPDVARRRTPRTIRRDDGELALQFDSAAATVDAAAAGVPDTGVATAPRGRRVASALIDAILLGAIDGAVLYLTLAIAGVSFENLRLLPPIPMGAFLLLLNGGYLFAFTAANGQTIGKMLAGLRVVGDDGGRVDPAGALLRGAGIALSCVTLGLPYLPALLANDGRALHDRLAGTRVIRIA